MGSGSKQTVGYKYFASVARFIGFKIDGMLAVNFDKRKWVGINPDSPSKPRDRLEINEPDLYGEVEGGVVGVIDVMIGGSNQEPNPHYQQYDSLISGYPFQSYLVFRGDESQGFYHGNTNSMKECLLWPKRTRSQNDGSEQWYQFRLSDNAIVCEIDAVAGSSVEPPEEQEITITYHRESMFRDVRQDDFNSTQKKTIDFNSNATVFSFNHSPGAGTDGGGKKETYAKHSISVSPSNIKFKYEVMTLGYVGSSFDVGDAVLISSSTVNNIETSRYIGEFSKSIEISGSTQGFGEGGDTALVIEFSAYGPEPIAGEGLGFFGTDINPIHKIREILVNPSPWGMGKPESRVNNENFMRAADRIYDERLGISWAIKDKNCLEAINELCYHIEAGIRVNRQTGQYEIVLFRDDWFKEDQIHKISESKIKSMQAEITDIENLINQVDVKFYNRDEIKDGAFSIAEVGLIKTMGHASSQDINFPYFMNQRNAEIVANWKLKQISSGAWHGTFTTGWKEARAWNLYDLIQLSWPSKWQQPITVRITSIGLGDCVNNTVTIKFVEIVPYSSLMNQIIVSDDSTNKFEPPIQCRNDIFELPYYFAVMSRGQREIDSDLEYESGYGVVGAVAEKPQQNSIYASLEIEDGDEWDKVASIEYALTSTLDQKIGVLDSNLVLNSVVPNLSNTLIKCSDEFLLFESFDETTKTLKVKRGLLDTIPQSHSADTILYFCGNDIDFAQVTFIDNELVTASVRTTTPSGIAPRITNTVIMNARAIRPYPTANVKFNNEYYPEFHSNMNDLVLTWAYRNRVQQTSPTEHVDWFSGDITSEIGVTYSIELIVDDVIVFSQSDITTSTATIIKDVFAENSFHTLKLYSVRDGYESYQQFTHIFYVNAVVMPLIASTTRSEVSGTTLPTANILVDIDNTLTARMQVDGSKISGKALAGSIITVNIED